MSSLDVFDIFSRDYARERFETMSLRDWLLAARDDKIALRDAARTHGPAIGEAALVDTAQDPRLARLFSNRTIKMYPGLLWLLRDGRHDRAHRRLLQARRAGPRGEAADPLSLGARSGGGKSSLAERLKDMMEKHPIYVLKAGDVISPVSNRRSVSSAPPSSAISWPSATGIERHRVGRA